MHKQTVLILALVALIVVVAASEAKLLRHSRYYPESDSVGPIMPVGPIDSPIAHSTGERAIVTVRGTRNPYDGSAPAKIAIEDDPYRGPLPRGVYDRLDGGYGGMRGRYPRPDYPYGGSGYGGYGGFGGYGDRFNQGYGRMYGAPSRIAVTGAYPVFGSRYL